MPAAGHGAQRSGAKACNGLSSALNTGNIAPYSQSIDPFMPLFSKQKPQHDFACYQSMTEWYQTPLGQHLLSRERELVDNALVRRFGYHLLQLGCSDLLLHEQSPMGHKFSFTPFTEVAGQHGAVAEMETIPLATASVDGVLLHHALDYAQDQHQLLREVARVLIADGHVVVVGFNPLSTWGLRNKSQYWGKQQVPWHAAMLNSIRVCDWLKLLDFQIDQVRYAEYAWPINSPRAIRYTGWLEGIATYMNWPTGAIYVITASKRVLPLTPVVNPRRRLPQLVLPMPEKAAGKVIPFPPAARERNQ